MDKQIEILRTWLAQPDIQQDMEDDLKSLLSEYEKNPKNPKVIEDIHSRFCRELEFGTGGMRGVVGAGTNRMNIYTVRRITQGLADYINMEKRGPSCAEEPSVAIGYDNRRKSDVFAFETACVLLENGINVYLFPYLVPTPTLSFAVRHLKCCSGVMITASHNPKEYNGYKLYDSEGCQCLPDEAELVSKAIDKVDIFNDVKTIGKQFSGSVKEMNLAAAKIGRFGNATFTLLDDSVMDAFLDAVENLSTGVEDFSNLSVVFTPLHGAGNLPVRNILSRVGLTTLAIVKEQELPDENFTTCPYPNPEKREALKQGLALCEEMCRAGSPPDLLLATDPDCDRLGVAVRHNGEYEQLSGNEVGVLLMDYVCADHKRKNTLPEDSMIVKTIVSTPLAYSVARDYGVEITDVLTGFKYIGDQINLLEEKGEEDRYVFGFEESCGYLSGTHVRDKDAVNASMLLCEMAAFHKAAGITIIDRMNQLYEKYGYYVNTLLEYALEGEAGLARICRITGMFRENARSGMFSQKVIEFADYEESIRQIMGPRPGACDMAVGQKPILLPKADVVEYVLEDGSSFIVRPSGTEPKLKIYLSVLGKTRADAERQTEKLKEEIDIIIEAVK